MYVESLSVAFLWTSNLYTVWYKPKLIQINGTNDAVDEYSGLYEKFDRNVIICLTIFLWA